MDWEDVLAAESEEKEQNEQLLESILLPSPPRPSAGL